MENRFSVKDMILASLLGLLIVLVLLAMKEFDRQYILVGQIQANGADQLKALVAIQRALESGASSPRANSGSTAEPSFEGVDPFAGLRKLRADGKYDQGDWLVQNLGAPVANISPLLSTDVSAAVLQARVMESLYYRDPVTLDYLPLLATSYTVHDNTAAWQAYVDKRKLVPLTDAEITTESDCPPADKADDRKAYIAARMKEGRRDDDIGGEADCPPAETIDFTIRHGVTFSDGSPFSADDVVFTYDFIMNPKIDAPRDRQALERVKAVKKIGDDKVEFVFKSPYFLSFDLASGEGIMSKNFYGKFAPEDFNKSVGLLIGTGPYRMADPVGWKPGPGTIELVRNERYWGLPSSFDKLVFYQIEQESTEMVMYGNGELDVLGLTPEEYKLALKNPQMMTHSVNYEYQSPIAGYYFIAWNEKKDGKPTIFDDKRVRQAMTMMTDRDGLCKTVLSGYAKPARGPFGTGSPQDDPTLVDWQFDPDKARSLLKDAGFTQTNSRGILTKADGTELSFKLTYGSKNETLDKMMTYVKDNYAKAGIDMQLDPTDWTVMEQDIKSRNFDAISLSWSAGIEDDIYQMFDSSQIEGDADNFMSYANPDLDKAIRAARQELDVPKRLDLWHTCERILHDDQPYTFLEVSESLRLFDKRIENVQTSKTGLNFVQDWVMPIPWYVAAARQKYGR
jgi:peptide/nickel transport system substrate-binding protein